MSRTRAAALLALCSAMIVAACGDSWRAPEAPAGVDPPPAGPPPPSAPPATLPDLAQCARAAETSVGEEGPAWLKLQLHVDENGHVRSVDDDGSTVGQAVVACAQHVIAQMIFPPCAGCSAYETKLVLRVSPGEPKQPPPATTSDAPDPAPPPLPNGDKWL